MLKTISFATMHFAIAFTIAYLLTGDLMVGGLLAVIEPAVNTVGYFSTKNFGNTGNLSSQQSRC